nr:hypothetical protein [uncultured Carboxylicivirga sp.]
MIDYIKALITDLDRNILLNNPLLNFCLEVNPTTGELRALNKNNKKRTQYMNAFYRGLEFRIYESGSIFIGGSLHKYWNNGEHNYNDFNYSALIEVLKDIEIKFNINTNQLILKQLEIGVNIIPPIPTEQILENCFNHRRTEFKWTYVPDEGKYIQAKHSQYIIKIYDKAHHYSSKGFNISTTEIMRFEIKYTKMEKLKNLGIISLGDLLTYGLQKWMYILVKEWESILYNDHTINSDHPSILKYSNPLFWKNLKRHSSNGTYIYHRRKFKELSVATSSLISQSISSLIKNKCKSLIYYNLEAD